MVQLINHLTLLQKLLTDTLRQLFYTADVFTTRILVVDKTLPLVIRSIVTGTEGNLQGPKLLHDRLSHYVGY